MHQKHKQQNNPTVTDEAERIERELVENPDLVSALMERVEFQAIVRHETSFSGPLPPPEVIRGYDQILPGGAERIFAMAEREQLFRHQLENTAVTGAILKDRRGQWMGFSITIIILLIASISAWRGNTTFAGALIAIDLIGLVSVFVLGRRQPDTDK